VGGRKSLLEIELNEGLRRRREEVRGKIERLGESQDGDSSSTDDLELRLRELRSLKISIETLEKKSQGQYVFFDWFLNSCFFSCIENSEAEREYDDFSKKLQEYRSSLEKYQNQQAEDSAGFTRQQKNAERYHAKKHMLTSRKDECNRNIRDLGVLPEEAFEKYTNEKLDRVNHHLFSSISCSHLPCS
jgi:structural maintenance of chromosome 3 (chondroitin sulfate proteoglycan 6)